MTVGAAVEHALQPAHQRGFRSWTWLLLGVARVGRARVAGGRKLVPVVARGGRPNSRTLFAHRAQAYPQQLGRARRLPPVASSVMAKSWRSISPSERPGFQSPGFQSGVGGESGDKLLPDGFFAFKLLP